MNSRRRVAREAARLLYLGLAEEFIQAKEMAAQALGVDAFPSNYEVALELDQIADEEEGMERKRLLIRLREEALRVMRILDGFNPRLIGSVWRGTARRGSDIDIVVYASEPNEVEERLLEAGLAPDGEDLVTLKEGKPINSRHIKLRLESGSEVEVVVRPPDSSNIHERCDIYGDLKRGLGIQELEEVLNRDPLRVFIPRRRRD
ncbi:MAG: nucleotidyltransferase domain-containing protein [Candidatus Bathyarchaeia archaeon]|nr:nucleotidyltransferase domain-containing protein [Candidatus Bathyarchaeota archaeon]